MRRPAVSTWVLAAVAVGAVALAHADPWAEQGPEAQLVSTKSNARRLMPELADLDEIGATIELRPVSGDVVRVVADGQSHYVEQAGRRLGPADPEAVGGLWASLRMATTLRAVDDADGELSAGPHGVITVTLPDGEVQLWIGAQAPDGSGRYGGRRNAPRGAAGTWVIEEEVGTLLEQSALAWVAHRAVVLEPAQTEAVAFDDGLSVRRGADGLWRSALGTTTALLERTAVEHRLQRLVSARLDPWVDVEVDTEATPWVVLTREDGREFPLWRGGACPGRPGRIVVARGPGLRGCLDEALATPWPVPGRGSADDGEMLDHDLVAIDYGRVLRIELQAPGEPPRTLARHGGGFRIEHELAGQAVATEVDESEVYRWFQAAAQTQVRLADPPAEDTSADAVQWTMTLDSATSLRLRCVGGGPAQRCRRGDGPWLSIEGRAPVLVFDPETFTDRSLVTASVDDVRAVEVLPGPGGQTLRQSAHFDLGVWRLDAPLHPATDAALDEDSLQALMAAALGARAVQWLDDADVPAERIVRLELTPTRDRPSTIDLSVGPDCRVVAPGRRPARVSEGTCESLAGNLLRADVGAFSLLGARRVTLTFDGQTVRLVDDEGTLVREDEAPLSDAADVLARLRSFRGTQVREGAPPGEATITAEIQPLRGAAYTLTAGDGWVSVAGDAWHYQQGEDVEP